MTEYVPARRGGVSAQQKWQLNPPAVAAPEFRADVLSGLGLDQKTLPSKYLYDRQGSALFDQITVLPEYYLSRAEEELLYESRDDIAALIPPNAQIVEYGAGSARKAQMLLQYLDRPAAYVPVDINADHLAANARDVHASHPGLAVRPRVADFTAPFHLDFDPGPRVGFFPGSTIGNFSPSDAELFLRRLARQLGHGGSLLIGVDVKKDSRILWDAYNDASGVTAAFNRNILTRINREIGAGFDPQRFTHHAPYNVAEGRVEMHLVAEDTQSIYVGGHLFCFRRGETIHTENSYKYGVLEFRSLARRAGFRPQRTWNSKHYSIHFLRVA